MEAYSWCAGNDFKKISLHLHRYPTCCFAKSVKIESPYTAAAKTRFVQPGKIEIDANERAVIKEFKAAFSFAPPSILSLTIFRPLQIPDKLIFVDSSIIPQSLSRGNRFSEKIIVS